MPGRTPAEAAHAFLEPLQKALGCVAHGKITPSPGGRAKPGAVHGWALNEGRGVRLSGGQGLKAAMWYQLIEDAEKGPWRATTHGYMYSIENDQGSEMFSAHWHPNSPGRHLEPHLHLPFEMMTDDGHYLAREPLYTGRFTFEAAIRFAITNVGAEPLCDDWENRLLLVESTHRLYRSWHQTPAEVQSPE